MAEGPFLRSKLPARAGASSLDQRDRLLLLAACLGWERPADDGALRLRIEAAGAAWPDLVALANSDLLAPTLWSRLRAKGLEGSLPDAAAAYLRRSHSVNIVRNERIKAQRVDAIRAMNARGVEPVILKGAVDLFVSRYDDPGARILRDVDLFIPRDAIPDARAALLDAGYRELPPEPGKFVTYFVEFTRTGAIVPYDVQWFISGQRDLLGPDEAWRDSILRRDGDLRVRTLSAEHQIVHNLLHSELQDRGADLGFVWLRQLLDLAALVRQLGVAVAWPEVQARFVRAGVGSVVAKRLYLAHRLLGLPMPDGIAPTLAGTLHHRRALAQLRWPWLTCSLRLWATMTSPIDPRLLDLVYSGEDARPPRGLLRVRHVARLMHRYGANLPAVIRKRHRKFDRA